MNTIITRGEIINKSEIRERFNELKEVYQNNKPYPHISIDHLLAEDAAKKAMRVFPKVKDAGWIHYVHVNEKKHGLYKMDLLPEYIQQVIQELNSPECVSYIGELTGIENLLPDDKLEGGGLHQTNRGGFFKFACRFYCISAKNHVGGGG